MWRSCRSCSGSRKIKRGRLPQTASRSREVPLVPDHGTSKSYRVLCPCKDQSDERGSNYPGCCKPATIQIPFRAHGKCNCSGKRIHRFRGAPIISEVQR
jgi:hypothetical protein